MLTPPRNFPDASISRAYRKEKLIQIIAALNVAKASHHRVGRGYAATAQAAAYDSAAKNYDCWIDTDQPPCLVRRYTPVCVVNATPAAE